MGTRLRASFVLVLLAAACTFPPQRTPTPSPSPTPPPAATTTPSPTLSPTTTPEPTLDAAAIPTFSAGDLIATAIDGLRVRQRPGVSSLVVTGLLPFNATLQVVMGPIVVEDLGWYLVTDADADEPQFEEGWIASGEEPEPFLTSTGQVSASSPFVDSVAQTGDAQHGPIEIGDGEHLIRWVALDPERVRCEFTVMLARGAGDPVPVIRATVGNGIDPGTLQPPAFDALEIRGRNVFVTVDSDCTWALVIQRASSASPSAAP